MQLSPLQSRLAASLVASCLLFILYLFLFAPQFASATDVNPIPTGHILDDYPYDVEDDTEPLDLRAPSYEPEFSLFDRSIMGRAANNVVTIGAEEPRSSNIDPGTTNSYVFEPSSVSGRPAQDSNTSRELRRSLNGTEEDAKRKEDDTLALDSDLQPRQHSPKRVYISANTCSQPDRVSPDQTSVDPPQLTLFVSTSKENMSPGPGKDPTTQKAIVFKEGAVMYNTSTGSDIVFSISAPSVSKNYFSQSSPYNYEVAVSLERHYHAYQEDTENEKNRALYWVDSDADSTLLKTKSLATKSDEVISDPPYVVFVQNTNNPSINGIRKSYCGLKRYAQIRPLDDGNGRISTGLRKTEDNNSTIQEFFIGGLNASSDYKGILAINTNSSIQKREIGSPIGGLDGGLIVYNAIKIQTKPIGACTVVFNLTMCPESRYAVPGNQTSYPNRTALAGFYDDYVKTMYESFDKVLQQTPCQAPSTQQYSLARNCNDCKKAYKDWLCTVAVPKCDDFSTVDEPFLHMRNINKPFPNGTLVDKSITDKYGQKKAYNSSRNLAIDEEVQPGPYKERLPCDYLCYELVRSCPASMGFSCPVPDSKYGFNTSYAVPDRNRDFSCNYPGSAAIPSSASIMTVTWASIAIVMIGGLLAL
ncbi:stretch-activated Ca2+-permeable channel component-domain-containing protein [Poronia punctata]|nr:stretch-activated Ca2+-permeable channel component-domain-containing protein [Poronia punctata]